MRAGAVVVNYNGGEDLPRCLDALAAQAVPVEVVLVDCASSDGSRRLAECPPTGVVGLPLAENVGYCGGANAGIAALGNVDVIGIFNPDCFAARDLFAVCLEAFDRDAKLAGVAPRLVRADGATLDSCGQLLTPLLLRVRDRGYGQAAAGRFEDGADVLAACGAGMVYRRAALAAVAVEGEPLPTTFFSFWEDLDLGWRMNNAGWRVRYEPRATAVHRRAATAGAGGGRLIFRRPPRLQACILANRWAVWARNLHPVDFLARAPVLLLADAVMVALVAIRRPLVLRELAAALPRVVRAWRQRALLPRRRLAALP